MLKALRKEPERRYASVEQLSEDVRRHLEGRPVLARPDTLRYRAGKFVRRNSGLVATAAVLGLSLVVALASPSPRRARPGASGPRPSGVSRTSASSRTRSSSSSTTRSRTCPARRRRGSSWSAAAWSTSTACRARAGRRPCSGRSRTRTGGWATCRAVPTSRTSATPRAPWPATTRRWRALRALDAAQPGDPLVRRDLATALYRKGTLLADAIKDSAAAVTAASEALAIIEAVVAAAPQTISIRCASSSTSTPSSATSTWPTASRRSRSPTYEKALPQIRGRLPQDGRQRGSVQLRHRPGQGRYGSPAGGPEGGSAGRAGAVGATFAALVKERHDITAQRSLSVVLNYIGDIHTEAGDHAPPSPPIARPWPCARCSLRRTRAMRWRART